MKSIETNNIYTHLPPAQKTEVSEKIISNSGVKIERITSLGQATLPGKWLESKRNEWVILLKGKAKLRLRSHENIIHMEPGDHIYIPAGIKHRVEWTDPGQKSVWVAVMFGDKK